MITLADSSKRRTAIYIRVSTAEQKIDGYSLESQEKKLVEFVSMNAGMFLQGSKKDWLYTDTHTGSDLNRTGLNKLLQDVRDKKFDAVLVWKIDRMSRSLKHLLTIFEEMQKHDVSFISVQENIDFKGPIGSLIFQIFGAIAQFERELIKGRTFMGKMASADLGNYTGPNIPYGYEPKFIKGKKGKTLAIIPEEKKWVARMYEWYVYENLGDGQIAKKLTDAKVEKYKYEKEKDTNVWRRRLMGTKWTDKMVTPILTNTIYRGEYLANMKDEAGNILAEEKWTIVPIPECVSEFTFAVAQTIRENKTGGSTDTDYMLSGKMIDMTLEKPKRFSGAKRYKGGYSYRRKQFKKGGVHTPVFEISGKAMDEFIWGKIMEAMKEPEVFIKHYLSREYSDPTKIQKIEDDLRRWRLQKINAELAIGRIQTAHDHGTYSEEVMAERVTKENATIVELDEKIGKAEDDLKFIGAVDVEVQKLRDAAEQLKYRLEKLDDKQKKILCNLFVEKIEMKRERVGDEWKVTADIFYRFNPKKFGDPPKGGRTQPQLQEANKSVKNGIKDLNGGSAGI